MPARTRSRSTRVFGALAAAIAATAVLSACGSDDSTATSTPSATTTTATTSTSTPESDETTAAESTTRDADTSAASSSPAAAPAPGAAGAPTPTAEDEAFLAALREEGVEPSDEVGAISIASYICSAQAQGGTPDEIKTFVTALVGSESVTAGAEITEEQASATADTYITVASDTYCS